jgi:putative transposase
VFPESGDYEKYLHLLGKYKRKFKFLLYCFCLMSNHVHLVIEVDDPATVNRIMRGLSLSYTLYFNFKYNKVGHLWQDRFLSRVIYKDAYLLDCINYIETNPVRAEIARSISQYPWSSYALRLGQKNSILDTPEL